MTYIDIKELNVIFKSYGDDAPSLKEAVIRLLKGRKTNHTQFRALKNINTHFNKGDRVGIIGKNGAGKSTLLKTIIGIYPPNSGSVEIKGNVVPLLSLGAGFDMSRTARENIYLNGAILGFSKSQIERLEQEILDFSELADFKNMPLKKFSTGMRGRLSFSIASSVNPDILILDEVFASGDASFLQKAKSKMLGLIDSCDILLMVSHQEGLVKELCNRVILLNKGVVCMDASPDDAYDYYKNHII